MRKLQEKSSNTIRLTREEEEDLASGKQALARAEDNKLENLDQIKGMRRKMMYAQCANIRDMQIKEKEKRQKEIKAHEERLDILMEINRLKEIKRTEEEKKLREKSKREDAAMIRVQIAERERQRLMEEELLQREGEQMKAMCKRQEIEAQKKRVEHAIASKKLLEEVLAANDMAVQRKDLRRQEEKEEDEKILQWQAEKRRAEEAHEAEKAAIKAQKDKEFFEVAQQMKRHMDNRSEEDALRARRHQQEHERRDREAARALKEKKRKQLAELKEARETQQRRKLETLKRLAIEDKEEWIRIAEENQEIQARIDETIKAQQDFNIRHQKELRKQMLEREELKKEARREHFAEGDRIKRENERFLRTVEKKKQEIIKEMETMDIDPKYMAEVKATKITLG